MLDILEYVFSSAWIFLGIVILLSIIGEVICNVVANICRAIVGCKSVKK